jgi:hypothetical protein
MDRIIIHFNTFASNLIKKYALPIASINERVIKKEIEDLVTQIHAKGLQTSRVTMTERNIEYISTLVL